VGAILAAAEQRVRAAGALLAGGHTLRDDEPKYGLAVVGIAHPEAVWQKGGARPGNALLLTKPLGTGLVLHGVNRGLAGADELAAAVRSMRALNGAAADVLRRFEPSAVTDVTGFGLFGHAHEMARQSGALLRIDPDALVALPGALEVARAGERTGGDSRNREYVGDAIGLDGLPDELAALGFDPQTAGGLLVAIAADRAVTLEAELAARDVVAQRIGSVETGAGVVVG
jgi:selenide,water dikinase